MDTSGGTDEAAALEGEDGLVQNKGEIPLYNKREMKSQGNYIVELLLKAKYLQGSRFVTELAQQLVSDASWGPEN